MSGVVFWLQSSSSRVYPSSVQGQGTLVLSAAANDRLSFQACVRNESVKRIDVELGVVCPDGMEVSVRRVGYVPVPHFNTETPESEIEGIGQIPGLVPDPLFLEQSVVVGPFETQSFWISVKTLPGIASGVYEIPLHFSVDGAPAERLSAGVQVYPVTIREKVGFPVTHWIYADSICDWYGVEPFGEPFWRIVEPYMRNLAEHGNDCLYVPIFTPPTDGVKRPTQLLKISESGGRYSFDFSDVCRWVNLGKACGAKYFEWTHLFSQWGAEHVIRMYNDSGSLLWSPETGATSDTYRGFLSQFLPAFRGFLQGEGLLDNSVFHLSDEPHGDEHLANYRKARALLHELAPWMRVADALSDVRFGKEGLTDIPVPSISAAKEYAEAGIPSWVYYCCGPRGKYINRLTDTPLSKIRLSGWLFYKLNAKGFLHWGYNYWNKRASTELVDPFTELAAGAWPDWAYGDTFVVYPGEHGPIDSLRWEVFAESLNDYALLQTLGVPQESTMLAPLRGYDDFPRETGWVESARREILSE